MKFKSHIIIVIFIGVLMSLTSCFKDSDFSSTDNRLHTQTIDTDLIITTLQASDFLDTNQRKEVIIRTDTMLLEGINSEFYLGPLTKIHLTFKFINTLERDFSVDFEFLNDDHMSMHTVHVPVSSGSIDAPMNVEATVSINELELITFKEASKLVYKIILPPSEKPLNTDIKGKLSLQSKASYFFDI